MNWNKKFYYVECHTSFTYSYGKIITDVDEFNVMYIKGNAYKMTIEHTDYISGWVKLEDDDNDYGVCFAAAHVGQERKSHVLRSKVWRSAHPNNAPDIWTQSLGTWYLLVCLSTLSLQTFPGRSQRPIGVALLPAGARTCLPYLVAHAGTPRGAKLRDDVTMPDDSLYGGQCQSARLMARTKT
jgi:hypothetical protein